MKIRSLGLKVSLIVSLVIAVIICINIYIVSDRSGILVNELASSDATSANTAFVKELERLRYPRQYVRSREDAFTHLLKHSFGVRTDSKTRPVMISGLIQAVREDAGLVSDEETLLEMLTFVRNEEFRPEAEAGAHDDCVMALAIAHYIRPQQRYTTEEKAGEKVKWTEDMWEDYNNADEAARRMLIEKWGSPS